MAPNPPDASSADFGVSLAEACTLIPAYNGARDELNRFVRCCDALFTKATTEKDKELFFNVLQTKVSGPADEIIDYGGATNWVEFRAALLANFKISRETVLGDLKKLRQSDEETVEGYSRRVTRVLGELNKATVLDAPETVPKPFLIEENEKTARYVFINGLSNERLQTVAHTKDELDLLALINYVISKESVLKNRDRPSKNGNTNGNSGRQGVVCPVCNKHGHTKENCFKNKALPSYGGAQIKKEIRRIVCSYCERPNHGIYDCRMKKYDDRQRNYLNNRQGQSGNGYNGQRENRFRQNGPQNNGGNRNNYSNHGNNGNTENNGKRQVRTLAQDELNNSGNELTRDRIVGHPPRSDEVQAVVHRLE